MNRTGIEWCDWTWNPIVGCSPASEGCANCYAEKISRRFGLPWGKAHFLPERLGQPAKVRKPGRVFVCSMGDLFHESVPRDWQEEVMATIDHGPSAHHTFIVLTKRPQRMVEFFGGRRAPENVWIGVTAENQARANERIPILLSIPAAVRFVSVEPMLEYVNIEKYLLSERDKMGFETQYIESPGGLKTDKLDWVIVGPETGPGARPCDDAWIDGEPHAYAPFGLAEQCAEWGCAFFDKRKNWTRREWPK